MHKYRMLYTINIRVLILHVLVINLAKTTTAKCVFLDIILI